MIVTSVYEISVSTMQEAVPFAHSMRMALDELLCYVPRDRPFRIRFNNERPRLLSIVVMFGLPKEG